MAQKITSPKTAGDLTSVMTDLFADLVNDKMSLDKAKSVQNHSAKIMTIQAQQLVHDKYVGNKKTNSFFER